MAAIKVTDDFNRGNSNPIGGNWTTVTGNTAMQITSNAATFTSISSDAAAYWNLDTWSADQYAQAKLTTTGTTLDTGPGVIVRASTSANTFYRATVSGNASNISLYKVVAGTFTQLWARTATFSGGSTLRLEVRGSTLRVLVNGVAVGADTVDTAIANGKPGMAYSSSVASTATVDDWEAGDFGSDGWPYPQSSPISLSGPYNVRINSTWDFFVQDTSFPDTGVDVFPELVTVSVVSNDGDTIVAPNANTITAAVVANSSTPNVSANAGHASVSVSATSSTVTVQPNAGTTAASVVANTSADNVQPNAGTTTAAVSVSNPASSIAVPSGTTTVGAVANNSTPSLSANAGLATVAVSVTDASVVGLEEQAGFKMGPSPVPFGLNAMTQSTWDFRILDIPVASTFTSVDAGLASVSVVANNDSIAVASNADTTSVGTAASNPSNSLAANAGHVSVSVAANAPNTSQQSNAGTTSVSGAATNGSPSVSANADIATVNVSILDTIVDGQENQAGFKNGPSPIPGPLNNMALDTWNFYGQPSEILAPSTSAFAGSADVSATANSSAVNDQPNAGTSSAAVVVIAANSGVQPSAGNASVASTANQPGASVKVGAGIATATVSSLQVTINSQPGSGASSVIAVANNGSLSISVNAGIAAVGVTAYQPTTPIAGVANAGFASVSVSALVASVVSADGSIHDYSGLGGLSIAGEHSENVNTSKSGISGATEISNSSNTSMRVEGG